MCCELRSAPCAPRTTGHETRTQTQTIGSRHRSSCFAHRRYLGNRESATALAVALALASRVSDLPDVKKRKKRIIKAKPHTKSKYEVFF